MRGQVTQNRNAKALNRMIYLFHGPDEFTRSEALAELRASLPAEVADFNLTLLDGRKLKSDDLVRACEVAPFLAERRLVIVTDVLKHAKAGPERDALRAYLERVPPTCDLVFVEGENVDRRSSLFTYLKKTAQIREFQPREGAELRRWLDERARRLQVQLDAAAAQRLVDYAGNNSRTLVNELSKLASYVGQGGRISASVVDLLVQDGQEQNLFAFIDNLSLRRRGTALQGLRSLLDEGQAATYILFMLARQVRILLGVRELAAQRLRPDEIATHLGQKPFVVRKALEQARGFEAGRLEVIHDRLLELDRASKTGRIQADVALELLVLEVCDK
jgi:DNA polymerase-3 subunit delta